MAKEFFKDLPDTSSPIIASRLNGLLDGEEAMGNLVVDSIRSKNMLSLDNIISGYYSINDGSYGSSSTACCTASKIEIDNTKNYVLSTSNTQTTSYMYVMYYNSSGTYLGYISVPFSSGSVQLNTYTNYSNAKYVNFRFDVTKNNLINPMLEEGSQVTNYMPYQELKGLSAPIELLGDTTPVANTSYTLNDSIFNYKYILIVMTSANTFANSSREYIPISQLSNDYNYRVALSVFQSTTVYMFLDLYFDEYNGIRCNGITKGTTGWTPHIKVYGIK